MAVGVVVEVGETRTGLCHPGYRPGIQSEPDNREARPRRRARGPSRRTLRLRDTRCVPLDRYGLDRMKPGLIVVKGHPGLFAQAKDQKGVPQVHLRVPVMEDSILYNLPNIEWYILDNGEVEQATLGCHLTHIRRRDKTRSDEVMPNLGNEGQMLGLEIDRVARTINPPLTPALGQYADDLRVVGVLAELIKGPRRDML